MGSTPAYSLNDVEDEVNVYKKDLFRLSILSMDEVITLFSIILLYLIRDISHLPTQCTLVTRAIFNIEKLHQPNM